MASESLYNAVVAQLGYKWADDDTKQALMYQIDEAVAYLRRLDPTADPDKDAWICGLVTSYVLYQRANAGDDFRKNYRNDLLALADQGRVNADAG